MCIRAHVPQLVTSRQNLRHYTCAVIYAYGVATISRLLKIIVLFCRKCPLLHGSFAKETYLVKEPTNRSHVIYAYAWHDSCISDCCITGGCTTSYIQHVCLHVLEDVRHRKHTMCAMTCSYGCCDAFICVTWFMQFRLLHYGRMWDIVHTPCVPWRGHTGAVIHSYVWHDSCSSECCITRGCTTSYTQHVVCVHIMWCVYTTCVLTCCGGSKTLYSQLDIVHTTCGVCTHTTCAVCHNVRTARNHRTHNTLYTQHDIVHTACGVCTHTTCAVCHIARTAINYRTRNTLYTQQDIVHTTCGVCTRITCAVTHSYVCCDEFMCVTWVMHLRWLHYWRRHDIVHVYCMFMCAACLRVLHVFTCCMFMCAAYLCVLHVYVCCMFMCAACLCVLWLI